MVFVVGILSGCEQAKAPSQNKDSNSSITIVPNQQDTNSSGSTSSNSQSSQVQTLPTAEQTQSEDLAVAKTSVMLKMIEDGFNLTKDEKSKKQGMIMMDRGISLLKQDSAISVTAKTTIEKMENATAIMKEQKTFKEGSDTFEKFLGEFKKTLSTAS